ncbi:MAG TPA: 50S ribosomal protein L32 [Candidatus Jacksonbacteria bacterium]|nr:50S ribosomal protein L32 [Candidatus Jacksonbacteria bacterium]
MSVPPKRHSSSQTRRRRTHHILAKKSLDSCVACGKSKLPHRACSFCGVYRASKA